MSARRLLPLILLNVFVSAAVVLGILYWWDNRDKAEPVSEATAALVVPTVQPTQEPQVTEAAVEAEVATAEPELPTYTVQRGDTLGSIVAQFDISLQDIMTANGISDPDLLQEGQVLIIPEGGSPADAPPPTTEPEPATPALSLEDQFPSEGEAIVDIDSAVGIGEVDEEAILIKNSGNLPIALLGWRLTDEDGRAYTFGQVTLFGEGAAITLHSGRGIDRPADLYWGFDEAVLRPGETVTLVDDVGNVRATFVVGS
jgi:LysM repeat protein